MDVSSAQTPLLRESLDRLHRWHRENELPAYADLLSRMASLAHGPVQAEQVCEVGREIQQRMDQTMQEAIRAAAPLATLLEAGQIRHLSTHLERKNNQWEEQWLQGSPTARLQRRLDKMADRYDDFYGSLSATQLNMLRRQLDHSVWSPEWGRQERLRQQRLLLTALMRIRQERMSAQQAEATLSSVWANWLHSPLEPNRQGWEAWTEQGCHHLAELHNSTSLEQRQRAVRRLRAYEKDLRELATKPS